MKKHSGSTVDGNVFVMRQSMARLVWADRKGTVTQTTTVSVNAQGVTVRPSRWISRRPHWDPLLSAENRILRLQLSHHNWTVKEWKTWNCFLLRHRDGRVRLWQQHPESKDPTCLVSVGQASGDGGVGNVFLNMTTSSLSFSAFLVTKPESNGTSLGCCRIGDSQLESAPEFLGELCDAITSTWTTVSKECFQHFVVSVNCFDVLKAKEGTNKLFAMPFMFCWSAITSVIAV